MATSRKKSTEKGPLWKLWGQQYVGREVAVPRANGTDRLGIVAYRHLAFARHEDSSIDEEKSLYKVAWKTGANRHGWVFDYNIINAKTWTHQELEPYIRDNYPVHEHMIEWIKVLQENNWHPLTEEQKAALEGADYDYGDAESEASTDEEKEMNGSDEDEGEEEQADSGEQEEVVKEKPKRRVKPRSK